MARPPRTRDLAVHLYAAILAQACNVGMTTMAAAADVTYRQLAWTSEWSLREDTLRAANAAIVNHQHRLPLSWRGAEAPSPPRTGSASR